MITEKGNVLREEFGSSILSGKVLSDLHIHSRFSRACSKNLNLLNISKWAKIKGLDLMGTGDFTHPEWLKELKQMKEKHGIYYFNDVGFVLSSEISLIYSQEGKGRRVHLVFLAPNFEVVDKINSWLDSKGRRDYDGRPIFGISCRDFVAKMSEIDERIEVIPAHIWTPYFGIFGSKTGFDSLKQAFGDQVDKIHAIETGISSDPEMNWRIKDLENISIISSSDAHSYWPWRLGREATIFYKTSPLTYDSILEQIRKNSFYGTIETDPMYGKYHYDGHAKCGFSCSPQESKKLDNLCPKCGKKLVLGVDYRVEELSSLDSNPKMKKPYFRMLPLHELISVVLKSGINSKRCWNVYDDLINNFNNEFNILLNVQKREFEEVIENKSLVEVILKNRVGLIKVIPGYDGVYGKTCFEVKEKQKTLF